MSYYFAIVTGHTWMNVFVFKWKHFNISYSYRKFVVNNVQGINCSKSVKPAVFFTVTTRAYLCVLKSKKGNPSGLFSHEVGWVENRTRTCDNFGYGIITVKILH